MPTPVSSARQCLTEEAARALDEAVAVARRRSHAQTTSLHLISALLSMPTSFLREACSRARTSACSPRLQFRALELNLSVSLDRLPTSKSRENDDVGPPVSNSLMAAIKRSQANQRRHSDNFNLLNPQTGSGLRVELKYVVLSVLDDPIVSRVFGEAGFRSFEVKLGILQPPVLGSPGFSRGPPLFMCNLGRTGFLGQGNGDEKRILDVMLGKVEGKNPLLVGVCACEVLKRFVNCISDSNCVDSSPGLNFSQSWIETRVKEVLPRELIGLRVISLEKDGVDVEAMGLKLEEVRGALGQCSGAGVLVNFGDLKGLVGEDVSGSGVSYLVSELKGLVEGYGDKLWLIGSSDSYETYLELVKGFPEIERDLDLHLLNITSSNFFFDPSTYKSSLMRSFVPFGGFFSTPDELRNPLSINESVSCCHLCTAKYEQEVDAVVNKRSTIAVADKYCENLPSWLQMADISPSSRKDVMQTVDDGAATTATILGLQKKWKDICRRLHHAPHSSKLDNSQSKSQIKFFEGIGFPSGQIGTSCSKDSSSPDEIQRQNSSIGFQTDLQTFRAKHSMYKLIAPETADNLNQFKPLEVPKCQQKGSLSTLTPCSTPIGSAISPSVFSVTNISNFRTLHASRACEAHPYSKCDPMEHLQPFSANYSATSDADGNCISHHSGHTDSCAGHCSEGQFDSSLYKRIRRTLAEKVGWQEEAICIISKAVSSFRTRCGRYNGPKYEGNIWLTFLGPDRFGKKQIASTIAETVFGGNSSLFYIDVNFQEKVRPSNSILEWDESDDYDVNFRKTPVDCIAAELRKKPRSVMFLDNVDKADPVVQSSLSQAVRTGKFPDSHGREIGIHSMIFVTTAQNIPPRKNLLPEGNSNKFAEEEVLAAKRWQLRISVEINAVEAKGSNEMNVIRRKLTCTETSPNKRKWDGTMEERTMDDSKQCQRALKAFLDLNLPAEAMEEGTSYGDSSESISENSDAWLEDFLDQVDEKVVFKPFDFDVLADKMVKLIEINFQKVFGSDALLEITHEVMVQLLAASWSSNSERAVENWIENVLTEGFREAQQKYQVAGKIIVRLASCEGILLEEKAHGICLPLKINT